MKSDEEIKFFYDNELKLELERLDKKLDKVNRRFSFKKLGIVLLLLLIATIFLFIQLNNAPKFKADKDLGIKIVGLYFLIALTFLILLYVFRNIAYKPIRKEYVRDVLNKIVNFVRDKLSYFPNQGISREEFYSTELFPLSALSNNTRKYFSFGLITGDLNKVRFKAAYVHTYNLNDSSSEKKTDRIHSVHKGLYAVIQIETKFNAPLIIRAKNNSIGNKVGQKITDFLGQTTSKFFTGQSGAENIKTGNVDLDNLFDTQCSDNLCLNTFSNSPWPALILKMCTDYNMKFDLLFQNNEFHLAIRGLNLSDFHDWKSFVLESGSLGALNQYNKLIGVVEEIDKLDI